MEFTKTERIILRMVQNNLPDSLTPYADIALAAHCTEDEVLALLTRLTKDGTIRRFGASIKHQRTGWNHNVMIAWIIPPTFTPNQRDEAGDVATRHSRVSHCYYRPSPAPDWPYTLYTMVHGKSEEDCLRTAEELSRNMGLAEYAMLHSLKELKKTSMTYFMEQDT